MKTNTKRIAYTGLMMGLCLIGTFIIQIPISPSGGYIHLGDGFVLLSGIVLGPVYGMLAAGIGSALADVLSGWAMWAIPTLIVKGLMAFITGYVFYRKDRKFINQSLFIGYIVIWSGMMFLVRNLFNNATEDLTGSNAFFDMLDNLFNTLDVGRLGIILSVMAIPLILVVIYKLLGSIQKKDISFTVNLSFVVAGSVMVTLYYITEYILYGTLYVPLIGIPLNILQFIMGIIIANLMLPIANRLKL